MKLLITLLLLFFSCSIPPDHLVSKRSRITISDKHFEGAVQINETSKGFKVAIIDQHGQQSDRAIFNFPWYQLDTADVNHDGRTEILVGVVKTAEFDPVENKRLFILRIDDGQLRPLWLGSKVCQQLVNFKAMSSGTIKTLEKTTQGRYAVGIYEWQGFGLALIKYIDNNKSYDEAISTFNI